ncbi:UNVERIFIED_ORG: hypothetical protein E4P37_17410 [Bacillus sp. AZ43]
MLIGSRSTIPADEAQILGEVQQVLERRSAVPHAPVSLAVSDQVAVGIAGMFSNRTEHGQVLEKLYRTGSVDSDELIEAARFEQGYATPEGHAALYCLIGWARARVAAGGGKR